MYNNKRKIRKSSLICNFSAKSTKMYFYWVMSEKLRRFDAMKMWIPAVRLELFLQMPCWDSRDSQQTGGGVKIPKSQRCFRILLTVNGLFRADCWLLCVALFITLQRGPRCQQARPSLRANEALVENLRGPHWDWRGPRWEPGSTQLMPNEASVALQSGTERASASTLFWLHTSMPAPEQLVASPLFFVNFQDKSLVG